MNGSLSGRVEALERLLALSPPENIVISRDSYRLLLTGAAIVVVGTAGLRVRLWMRPDVDLLAMFREGMGEVEAFHEPVGGRLHVRRREGSVMS